MRRDCLYRHKNNSTVALRVLTSFYIKEKHAWSLKVEWHNIGSRHMPWSLGITQRIRIDAADLPNWLPMTHTSYGPQVDHVSL